MTPACGNLLVGGGPQDGTEVARVRAPRSAAAVQARLACRAAPRGPAGLARTGATGRRGSKRWTRTAGRIGRIHARAADLRRDALHQATTRLAQRHQVIVVEDLAVANMTRRKPGAGKGGRGLNRALADAGDWVTRLDLASTEPTAASQSGGNVRLTPAATSEISVG